MMKKILAVLLAMLMLISACAMAEEASGGQLIVRDVVIDMGEGGTLDLSGVDLTLALAGDEAQTALRLALDAAGASVLNVIAAFDEEQLTLRADGISDVYALSYEDLIALIEEAAGEAGLAEALQSGFGASYAIVSGEMPAELTTLIDHAAEILPNAVTEAGTEDIDGVEYEVLNIDIDEDRMALLLDDLIAFLDAYAQDGLEGSGYDSYRQMFDEADLRMSVDGEVRGSEEEIIASINVNAFVAGATEPETLNIYVDLTEDFEYETVEVYVVLSGVDGEEEEELISFLATYTGADGEFSEFDLGIYGPDSNEASFYMNVCAPAAQGEGLWEFYLSIEDDGESMNFYLDFGSVDGQDEFYAHLSADEETLYINYEGADGVGTLSIGVMDGDESVGGVSATVEVAEDDGAWLPGVADATVDMLTVDDAQLEKLSMEGMSLLMNALSGLAQANETLGALIGSMMG